MRTRFTITILMALLILLPDHACSALGFISEQLDYGFARLKVNATVSPKEVKGNAKLDFMANRTGMKGNLNFVRSIASGATRQIQEDGYFVASTTIDVSGEVFLDGKEIYDGKLFINDQGFEYPFELTGKLFHCVGKVRFQPLSGSSKEYRPGDKIKDWKITCSGESFYHDPKEDETTQVFANSEVSKDGKASIPFAQGYADTDLIKLKIERVIYYLNLGFANFPVESDEKTVCDKDHVIALPGKFFKSLKARISKHGNKDEIKLSDLKLNKINSAIKMSIGQIKPDNSGFSCSYNLDYDSLKLDGTINVSPTCSPLNGSSTIRLLSGMPMTFTGKVETVWPLAGKKLEKEVKELAMTEGSFEVPFAHGNLLFSPADLTRWRFEYTVCKNISAIVEGSHSRNDYSFFGTADLLRKDKGPRFNISISPKDTRIVGDAFLNKRKIYHGQIDFDSSGFFTIPFSLKVGKVGVESIIRYEPILKNDEITDWNLLSSGKAWVDLGWPKGKVEQEFENLEVDKNGKFSVEFWKLIINVDIQGLDADWKYK